MAPPDRPTLILASTSRYRRALLTRLGVAFDSVAPRIDETPRPGEPPQHLALRLARAKAAAVAKRFPQAWVLGSDQVCACGGRLLGKPGTLPAAIRMLRRLSGRKAEFHSAVALRTPEQTTRAAVELTQVRFRHLTDAEIRRYVAAEPAPDCAGAFKCEGLGIGLFTAVESRDPTALVGLPLIAAGRLLRRAGWRIP
ncbi:MAG: septum formation protein Maf [Gammaproteobacteria bacterium]|nr:septum formation protein Maf [Gammaproteobacteria bacterium]